MLPSDTLPHRPDRLRLGKARCQHGIFGKSRIHRIRKHGRKRLVEVDPGQRVGQFDDQVPRRGELEGNGDMRHGRGDRLDLAARHYFETAEPVADGAAQALHDLQGLLDALAFEQRQGRAARRRKQLQHSRGDDAERSFGADEELLERVARIVLAQRAQAVEDASIRQHHFQPEHQIPHRSVAQHRRATGIGRDIAADLA